MSVCSTRDPHQWGRYFKVKKLETLGHLSNCRQKFNSGHYTKIIGDNPGCKLEPAFLGGRYKLYLTNWGDYLSSEDRRLRLSSSIIFIASSKIFRRNCEFCHQEAERSKSPHCSQWCTNCKTSWNRDINGARVGNILTKFRMMRNI